MSTAVTAPANTAAANPAATTLRQLVQQFPRAGHLQQLLLRPARGVPMRAVDEALALAGLGLQGDRAVKPGAQPAPVQATLFDAGATASGPKRQVTLIQAEHLPVIAALAGLPEVPAAWLRRNLVVAGLNLLAAKALFKDQPLRLVIGGTGTSAADGVADDAVLLEVTGPCEPCSQMEARLGLGGYNAVRGHGGVTARVLRGGVLRQGDTVRCLAG